MIFDYCTLHFKNGECWPYIIFYLKMVDAELILMGIYQAIWLDSIKQKVQVVCNYITTYLLFHQQSVAILFYQPSFTLLSHQLSFTTPFQQPLYTPAATSQPTFMFTEALQELLGTILNEVFDQQPTGSVLSNLWEGNKTATGCAGKQLASLQWTAGWKWWQ